MTKAIIFDFFGVICPDLHGIWFKKHKFRQWKFISEQTDKVDRGVITENDFIRELSKKTGVSPEHISVDIQNEIIINKGLLDFIAELRAREFEIGLLSNASRPFLDNLMRQNDLYKYFDHVLISSEFHIVKPERVFFEMMLGQLKTAPAETLFIDDNPKNVKGAVEVGIKGFVWKNLEQLRAELSPYL